MCVNVDMKAHTLLSSVGPKLKLFSYILCMQDLKDERKKARMAAARAVLEKCTMMLLTASKVNSWPVQTARFFQFSSLARRTVAIKENKLCCKE